MTPLLFGLSLTALAQDPSPSLANLFQALRSPSGASYPIHLPKRNIKIYAVNDQCTQMCYIAEGRIHLLKDGQITIPLYAKVFNVKAVNRITYKKHDVGGAFLFWIDDELALSIGT